MSKRQRFYCKVGQTVCDTTKFIVLIGFIYGLTTVANTLSNLI